MIFKIREIDEVIGFASMVFLWFFRTVLLAFKNALNYKYSWCIDSLKMSSQAAGRQRTSGVLISCQLIFLDSG
jgi:hypothetical protein